LENIKDDKVLTYENNKNINSCEVCHIFWEFWFNIIISVNYCPYI
jgi:hypothetical protein